MSKYSDASNWELKIMMNLLKQPLSLDCFLRLKGLSTDLLKLAEMYKITILDRAGLVC